MPPKKSTKVVKGTASASAAAASSQSQPQPATVVSYRNSLILLPFLALFTVLAATGTLYLHYKLPQPISLAASRQSELAGNGALFSEEVAFQVMEKLSVDIGYRIVGTKEHVEAEDWLEAELRKYEGYHKSDVPGGNDTQVEVWKQIADGSHRFDFMGSTVWKKYYNMSNLIVRISDGTEESKQHSVLLNAHIDSTLPSPGAADDIAGIAVMMEVLRILTTPPRPRLKHSVILLFNNGEESLQDASHLYITQHETAKNVKAVVNLEACGTSGPELLFQATSEEMIVAYGKVPWPFGTVLANDVFSSGIVLSDTDFRQFVEYGGLEGLDMAIIGNSYLYHTRWDIPSHVERGAVQHFGENILAIVTFLTTDPDSRLPYVKAISKTAPPVYFTVAGRWFILIPPKLFKMMSTTMTVLGQFVIQAVVRAEPQFGALRATTLAIPAVICSILAGVVSSNIVALIMTQALNKGMSWFSHEWLPIALYAPPALAGVLAVQYGFAHLIKPEHRPYFERAIISGMSLVFNIGLIMMNAFGIGSAYFMALGLLASLVGAIVNDFWLVGFGSIELKEVAVNNRVHPLTYIVLATIPAVVGAEGFVSFLDLFVPLTGRTGEISPADHIIATIVAVLSFLCVPTILPLAHRYGMPALRSTILALLALSVLAIAFFASPAMSPFDTLHPKRLFVHQVENITSGEWIMNLGSADPAPGFSLLVDDLQKELGLPGQQAVLVPMNENNTDFDILYPVSEFLTPYKYKLPAPPANEVSEWVAPGVSPTSEARFMVRALDEVLDLEAGTRRLTLEIAHPGLIWTVVAFNAEVLEWDLDTKPPQGHQRHHIKEVSRYGSTRWSIHLLLKLDGAALAAARLRSAEARYGTLVRVDASDASADQTASHLRDPSRLWVDFSGLDERGMWPQKKTQGAHQRNIRTFARMDAYLQQAHPEVDAMLLGAVAGVAVA